MAGPGEPVPLRFELKRFLSFNFKTQGELKV